MNPSRNSASAAKLTATLERLPAQDAATAKQLGRELVEGGPAVIEQLAGSLGEFGVQEGLKPKYALHALAAYASRPGAEAERAMVAQALAGQLAADHPLEAKAFLVRQLQLCGRPEEVPALAGLLTDQRLCDPATQALLAIGGPRAAKALREALPGAQGPRRVTISQALDILSGK